MTLPRAILKPAVLACGLAFLATGAVSAADPIQQHNSTAVWFENWVGLKNASLTVTTPDGTVVTIQAESGTPVYQLDSANAPDGVYRYELRAATNKEVKIVNLIDQGRGDAQRDSEALPFHLDGHFTVERGVIVTPQDIQEDSN